MRHCYNLYFGRHRGGFGRFGRGFMGGFDGDRGDRPFGLGRKLSSSDLQLLILGLLADKPSHGYEIIKALEERSKGFYAPSPGMVYPALTYLEEIGHATVEPDGTRKLYRISDAGRGYLEANRVKVDAIFAQFTRFGDKMERVRRAFAGADETTADSADAWGGTGAQRSTNHLRESARELRSALREAWNAAREEQQRVAEILKRATDEILGKTPRGQ